MMTGQVTATSATHQDLERFLAEPGCAICRYAGQAEERFFGALLYEGVLSPATAERMRDSNGFCGRHAQALLSWRNPMATAILYQYVLSQHQRELARWRRVPVRGRAVPRPVAKVRIGRQCPACEAEEEAEQRACAVLAAGLDSGSLRKAWQASAGLCWPHFTAARGLSRAGRTAFDAVESGRLERLAADVETLIRSYDYQWRGERSPQVESAWRRAVAAMAGRCLGGRPAARPGPGGVPLPGGAPAAPHGAAQDGDERVAARGRDNVP